MKKNRAEYYSKTGLEKVFLEGGTEIERCKRINRVSYWDKQTLQTERISITEPCGRSKGGIFKNSKDINMIRAQKISNSTR